VPIFDVRSDGVEVSVAQNDVVRLDEQLRQDVLGSASLMGGDHVRVADDLLNSLLEAKELCERTYASSAIIIAAHCRSLIAPCRCQSPGR